MEFSDNSSYNNYNNFHVQFFNNPFDRAILIVDQNGADIDIDFLDEW
jgi:hypothetical protein